MAEYFPLLERAVAGLQTSTPEARKALYERARTALLGQLRTIDPPVPEEDIQRESTELDEAISRVEANARQKDKDNPPPHPQLSAPTAPATAPPPAAPVAAPPAPARPPLPPRPAPAKTERVPVPSVPPPGAAPARERPAYPFRNLDSGTTASRSAPSVRPGVPPGTESQGSGVAARERSGSAPRLGPPARIVEPIRPGRPTADAEAGGAVAAPPVLPSAGLVSPAVQPPPKFPGRAPRTSRPLRRACCRSRR